MEHPYFLTRSVTYCNKFSFWSILFIKLGVYNRYRIYGQIIQIIPRFIKIRYWTYIIKSLDILFERSYKILIRISRKSWWRPLNSHPVTTCVLFMLTSVCLFFYQSLNQLLNLSAVWQSRVRAFTQAYCNASAHGSA